MSRIENNGVFNVDTVCAGKHFKVTCFFTFSDVYAFPNTNTYTRHDVTFSRLFAWVKGGGQIQMKGATPAIFKPGTLYLIPAGRNFICRYDGGSEFLYFHFYLSDFLGMELFSDGSPGVLSLYNPDLVREIAASYNLQKSGDSLSALSGVFHVICRLIVPFLDEKEWIAAAPTRYKAALEYAFENCRAMLSVKELSYYAGVSRCSLSRWLHRSAGVTLKEYLEKLLLRKAMRLLGGTGMSVKEVAVDLGFNDPLYFFRMFKRLTGRTPLAYRRLVTAGFNEQPSVTR
jgi:AraC-like DNA-binding protein